MNGEMSLVPSSGSRPFSVITVTGQITSFIPYSPTMLRASG